MNAKEHRIDGRIRYRYPTPIASPYRFSQIARTPVVRLGHVLGTIDQTVRFLCWLLLADYLSHAGTDQRSDEVEKQLLELPTFNTAQAMELLKALVSAANSESCFIPEILNAMESSPGQRLEALVKQMGHIII
ncbi:MAG TPA: hypothetical protein EYN66_03560, partial [Myxococcales bacterium]|nr:hypothetical protein [Myxococcales bacterium]